MMDQNIQIHNGAIPYSLDVQQAIPPRFAQVGSRMFAQ